MDGVVGRDALAGPGDGRVGESEGFVVPAEVRQRAGVTGREEADPPRLADGSLRVPGCFKDAAEFGLGVIEPARLAQHDAQRLAGDEGGFCLAAPRRGGDRESLTGRGDGVVVRIWNHPMVGWIWWGALIMAFGAVSIAWLVIAGGTWNYLLAAAQLASGLLAFLLLVKTARGHAVRR